MDKFASMYGHLVYPINILLSHAVIFLFDFHFLSMTSMYFKHFIITDFITY